MLLISSSARFGEFFPPLSHDMLTSGRRVRLQWRGRKYESIRNSHTYATGNLQPALTTFIARLVNLEELHIGALPCPYPRTTGRSEVAWSLPPDLKLLKVRSFWATSGCIACYEDHNFYGRAFAPAFPSLTSLGTPIVQYRRSAPWPDVKLQNLLNSDRYFDGKRLRQLRLAINFKIDLKTLLSEVASNCPNLVELSSSRYSPGNSSRSLRTSALINLRMAGENGDVTWATDEEEGEETDVAEFVSYH
jgi:hypothetical protein